MRIPPNLKYVITFLLFMGLIIAGVLYLPRFFSGLDRIMSGILTALMVVLVLFLFIKPGIGFLYARADGILKVYTDKNGEGLHVFSYHIHSGGDGDSLRDIQHYFIKKDTEITDCDMSRYRKGCCMPGSVL